MSDEVDLQKPGCRFVPIRERSDGDLAAGLRRALPLPAATCRAADRGKQSVDGRRTGLKEKLTDVRIEREMTMPLHGRDQARKDGLETFPTDAIRSLPENDEGLADRLGVDRPTRPDCLGHNGTVPGEEADRMLAMTAGDVNKLIKNLGFIGLRCDSIAFPECFKEFPPRRLADLGAHLRLQRLVTFW